VIPITITSVTELETSTSKIVIVEEGTGYEVPTAIGEANNLEISSRKTPETRIHEARAMRAAVDEPAFLSPVTRVAHPAKT
jgi:hypothetical protein